MLLYHTHVDTYWRRKIKIEIDGMGYKKEE